jgi:MFS transporter, AAHS family, 4-hydroxybenzoate transporter
MRRKPLRGEAMAAIIEVSDWIDKRSVSSVQVLVLALCAAAAAIDGFDAQNIGYVAPAIIQEWQVAPHDFTAVFVSGLIGLLIGCLLIAPLADVIGRRWILIVTLATFGIFSLASAAAPSIAWLSFLRFLTGLGLGGGMANAIAMTSEYFPSRMRSWMTVLMFCGFPVGASLGGLLAAALIPVYGWSTVFIVGGIVPLALAAVLAALLPESIRYLVAKKADGERVAAILRRIDPHSEIPHPARFVMAEQNAGGLTVKHLFGGGRSLGTMLIWVVFFASLLDIYLLTSWLPQVLHDSGLSISASAVATAVLQGGGVVCTLVVGPVLDRRGCLTVLLALYLLAAVGIAAIGSVGNYFALILLAACASGAGIIAGQNVANAVAAMFYPTSIRATGVGWALGIGRIGAIVGPTVGGAMLALQWSQAAIFGVGAIPALVAALAVLGLMRLERARAIAPG